MTVLVLAAAWVALNQTVCALHLFSPVTLGAAEVLERIPYARQQGALSEV